MASNLSSNDLLELGLSYVGFGPERQNVSDDTNVSRFRAHYGVGPKAVKALIGDLEQNGQNVTPKKLFMSICWLKLYDSEMVMAGRWGYGEQYCRESVREYVKRIRELKPLKISFDNLHPSCKFLGVDCIHAPSQEFRCDPDSKWWSHKFNGPGLSYEIVTDPCEGYIR